VRASCHSSARGSKEGSRQYVTVTRYLWAQHGSESARHVSLSSRRIVTTEQMKDLNRVWVGELLVVVGLRL